MRYSGTGNGHKPSHRPNGQQETSQVSNNKRCAIGLVLSLLAGTTLADELPHNSILQRYGVTPEQLPAGAKLKVEPKQQPAPSRFHIAPEQPWAQVRLGDGQQPETTGNISIDNAARQEYDRCQKVRGELYKRNAQQSISCDGSVPGLGLYR